MLAYGLQVYHKLCLKCQSCQKRLDQGSVVEHDLLVSASLRHVTSRHVASIRLAT